MKHSTRPFFPGDPRAGLHCFPVGVKVVNPSKSAHDLLTAGIPAYIRVRAVSMTLDVIIATHNRCSLLKKALFSLLEAVVPAGLQVKITVVDNNSSDQTAQVVMDAASDAHLPIQYLFEPRKGKPFAVNTGIACTNGELVGFIDDDERIDSSWYVHIVKAFRESSLGFIGGPYIPDWAAAAPKWLPRQAKGVIGCFEFGSTPMRYGTEVPDATLFGGNAILRRSVLAQVGPYRTDLQPHEDQEMFERLLASGFQGMYLPELVIHHWIPRDRLQKRYFRAWMWRAGLLYACMHDSDGGAKRIAGVPLYVFKKMTQSFFKTAWRLIIFDHDSSQFEAQLDLIYSISSAYGYFQMHKNALASPSPQYSVKAK
jgi:glucosyl-dolichyl phosphate glucuronosyltransferase